MKWFDIRLSLVRETNTLRPKEAEHRRLAIQDCTLKTLRLNNDLRITDKAFSGFETTHWRVVDIGPRVV